MTDPAPRGDVTRAPASRAHGRLQAAPPPSRGDTLADVLERVLDKGVVVVGDIGISVLDIELLTLRVRLLIASADTAREMGIDWWTGDPFLSKSARDENQALQDRISALEARLGESGDRNTEKQDGETAVSQGAENQAAGHQRAGDQDAEPERVR